MSVLPLFEAPLAVLAVLAVNVAAAEGLARLPGLRHLGAALLVILLTALAANIGIIPSVTDGSLVYDGIFSYLAPLAIFWLLLGVDLRSIVAAGPAMLALFALGAAGTVFGVIVAMLLVNGQAAFGEFAAALGGMFAGSYTGGSLNFNAVALEFDVQREGLLYAGAAVVDNLMTTVWMVVTIAVPRLAGGARATRAADALRAGAAPAADPVARAAEPSPSAGSRQDAHPDRENVTPTGIGLLLALGAGMVGLSRSLAGAAADGGIRIPEMLILTTIALVLAQIPAIRRIQGARLFGMFAVLLFLAAIGALCDVSELVNTGALGVSLSLFVVVAVCTHGLVIFGGARLLRMDPVLAAVASQANIGGGTSALALARSLGRSDLVAPALLIGSLGNAVGTYLGFLTAAALTTTFG